MLEVRDLHVRYGKVEAVSGISLDVAEGEVVGLIGPNGAGKTSTLSAIFGLLPGASGSVRFLGQEISGRPPEWIVRRGMALVTEGRHIFGSLTVEENLWLGACAGGDRAQGRREIRAACERFPILERTLHQPAGRLSGGEQQQLAIARALVARPRMILLDEPSLGLAPLMVDLVFATLRELRDEGITVLLVEQNAARTVAFADRTYVMRTGAVQASGGREELSANLDFAAAYLGA